MEGLEVDRNFWQGKRVLVTGHTGFKGSWLCLWLLRLGAKVYGYALPPVTNPSLFAASRLERDLASHEADVRDGDRVHAAVREQQAEVVFHLAAQALVHEAYARPLETYSTNVMGTANVLQAVRAAPHVRVAVIVTSDKCYETGSGAVRHSEQDPLGGFEPYSGSKACAEFVTAAYRSSFFAADAAAAIASARAGNVIGGGDWSAQRLIPDAVTAFHAGQPLLLRNPAAIRPWQHVLDPLRGYLMLAQHLWTAGASSAGAWNFGPAADHEVSVEDIVQRFAGCWGGDVRWQTAKTQAYREAPVLRLNSDRAQHTLGWQARLSIDAAVDATAKWYREYYSGCDARELVNADIAHFTQRAAAG